MLLSAAIIITTALTAHAQSDAELNQKIETLEAKILKVKSEMPQGDMKKYSASISDVENRKNNLKSMLKTPSDKRGKNWQQEWDLNYMKANEKIDKIKAE